MIIITLLSYRIDNTSYNKLALFEPATLWARLGFDGATEVDSAGSRDDLKNQKNDSCK